MIPAAFATAPAGPQAVPVDWRNIDLNARTKLALGSQGWILEEDGRALRPGTREPAGAQELEKAIFEIRQIASQASLEKLRLILSSGKPLSQSDMEVVASLSNDLPRPLLLEALDPRSDPAKLRALTDENLARIASTFDGSRTLQGRRDAAAPLKTRSRKGLDSPYASAADETVGRAFNVGMVKAIGRTAYGRTVLRRLNDAKGKAVPPPVLIDNLEGVPTAYDFRRGAILIDHETLVDSIVDYEPLKTRESLRRSLDKHGALLSYLKAHPGSITRFINSNDVLLVHELTHTWQDRRDPLLGEIVRGNVPTALILEFEREGFLTKNLYLHSKLANAPDTVRIDQELADYEAMMFSRQDWWREKREDYRLGSPAYALDLSEVDAIMKRRLNAAKSKETASVAQRRDKALDILALSLGQSQLRASGAAQKERLAALEEVLDRTEPERHKAIGMYYLKEALNEPRSPDRMILLRKAEHHAAAAKDQALIDGIRKAKGTPS